MTKYITEIEGRKASFEVMNSNGQMVEVKADKGAENGSCNRTSCQKPGAIWYNHGSLAWYCECCKNWLNDSWAQRQWPIDFPDADHPQFETREMMNARKV